MESGAMMGSKRKVAFWKKPAPKGDKPTTLSVNQKAKAKARAKAAGRPYPNLVDNAAVARTQRTQRTRGN